MVSLELRLSGDSKVALESIADFSEGIGNAVVSAITQYAKVLSYAARKFFPVVYDRDGIIRDELDILPGINEGDSCLDLRLELADGLHSNLNALSTMFDMGLPEFFSRSFLVYRAMLTHAEDGLGISIINPLTQEEVEDLTPDFATDITHSVIGYAEAWERRN